MILGSSFEILITHNNLHFHNQINDIEDGFITKVLGKVISNEFVNFNYYDTISFM